MKHKYLLFVLLALLLLTACSTAGTPTAQDQAPTDGPTQIPNLVQSTATAASEICPVEEDCATETVEPAQELPSGSPAEQPAAEQPVEVRGSFEYSNDIIATYYDEHIVALVDLYGFVTRDQKWEIPVSSQTLGFLDLDEENRTGSYTLQLPARPSGVPVDVNPDGKDETGVQVFSVGYFPNLAGGPYSEGDDPTTGWLSYLASTKNDSENEEEVIGGKLVVWSPDSNQFFPSGYGDDGLLFTDDDPVMPVPQGYSIIDLDQQPFQLTREEVPELALYEPTDAAIKDFSDLSYTDAFNSMFEVVRKEYAFNGIEGKQPDWDALLAELLPRVQAAEESGNAEDFYRVLRDFTLAFKDGHVGLNGGEIANRLISEQIAGGYGFAIRELDDGRVIANFVLQEGPADDAGMEIGAEILEFNGKPIDEAIGEVVPVTAPHSTEISRRFQQARWLLRAPVGTTASITFANPGEEPQTVDMTTVQEGQSLSASAATQGFDPNALPVEAVIATDDIGYIRINSNYDDLNLIIRLFQRALQTFEDNGLSTVIIDLRQNSGGAPLGLAGFLTDQEITLGQLQYFSEKTGNFESKSPPDTFKPMETQYSFDKMFLLVDQGCASACEMEAYGFSQVPGLVVVGMYPTAGVEAEVARGQFELPEDFSLQIPTGRFVLPDGSIFLEGVGVQPTELIPVTEETVLTSNDPVIARVLELAE